MKDSGINNCKEVEELISAYRDNELSTDERKMVDDHLPSCAKCRDELQAIDRVARSLKTLPQAELGRDLADDIVKLIGKSPKENVVPFQQRNKWIGFGVAAAAVALIAGVGTLMSQGGNGPSVADKVPEQVAPNKGTQDVVQQEVATQVPQQVKQESPVQTPSVATVQQGETISAEKKQPELIAQQPAKNNSKNALKVRMQSAATINYDDLSDDEAVVAFQEDSVFDQIGVSTDEDGLYAIKM